MATAGVSRRAVIKATGAIGTSVLPDVHVALAQERYATPVPSNSSTPPPLPSQAQSTAYLFLNIWAAVPRAAVASKQRLGV